MECGTGINEIASRRLYYLGHGAISLAHSGTLPPLIILNSKHRSNEEKRKIIKFKIGGADDNDLQK